LYIKFTVITVNNIS